MKYLLIVASILLFSNSAEAHHRHHYHHTPIVPQEQPFFGWFQQPAMFDGVRNINVKMHRVHSASVEMLAHPAGCPARLFCGCGAAVEVFGTPRRDLWLAANWGKFPEAAPAPGNAAWRYGHVFVLKQQMENGEWLVADYNSGGHASRLHVRSIAGYHIVNPRA